LKRADPKEIEAATKALDGVEIKLDKAYLDHRNEVRVLLNEEQKILFDRYGGLGMGLDLGENPRWGMRQGRARGFGPDRDLGVRQGYRLGRDLGVSRGFGGGWGRGLGRGFFCPWFRWR